MMQSKTVQRARGTAGGFTLVEMVIVIGVIILLAALTLSVSVAVVEGSEVRQTENTIRLLTAALQEWEAQADRKVSYGVLDEQLLLRTGAFDAVVVPDLSLFHDKAEILSQAHSLMSGRGIAIIACPKGGSGKGPGKDKLSASVEHLDYYQLYPQRIAAVTAETILESARRHMDPQRLIIVDAGTALAEGAGQ